MANYGRSTCVCGETGWDTYLEAHVLSCKEAIVQAKSIKKLNAKIDKYNKPILKRIERLEKKLK